MTTSRTPLDTTQFCDQLQHAVEISIRHKRPLSLLLVDRRHKEAIDRSLGDEVSKRLLESTEKALAGLARSSDLIGFREDAEFALLLPETGSDEARDCAMRLTQGISILGIEVDGAFLPIEVVVGGASWRPGDNAVSLVRRAQANLEEVNRPGPTVVRVD